MRARLFVLRPIVTGLKKMRVGIFIFYVTQMCFIFYNNVALLWRDTMELLLRMICKEGLGLFPDTLEEHTAPRAALDADPVLCLI